MSGYVNQLLAIGPSVEKPSNATARVKIRGLNHLNKVFNTRLYYDHTGTQSNDHNYSSIIQYLENGDSI